MQHGQRLRTPPLTVMARLRLIGSRKRFVVSHA
jgi:hypothetical protein